MSRFIDVTPGRLAIAVLIAAAAPAAAQQPVEFNHGFAAQGSAWVPTANLLRDEFEIETLTPTTQFGARFDVQSAQLRSHLDAWGRTGVIGMAHSNGGIVARNYTHLTGYGSRLNRLMTIGTPHRGAPIAQNLLNGRAPRYFGFMAGSIAGAFDFYFNNDPDWRIHPVVDWFTQNAFEAVHYLGMALGHGSAFVGFGFGQAFPATQDEIPGSTWITQFNDPYYTHSLEPAVLYRRVGVATQVNPNGALFRLISSDPRGWRFAQAIAASAALDLYNYYRNHWDWWLAAHADYWLNAYWYIALLDVAWADFTGALVSFNGWYARVSASDAFIPGWSSQYPNASVQYNMYLPYYDISHSEQMDHSATRNKFRSVLANDFGVPKRYVPPPPEEPECMYGGDSRYAKEPVCPY